jgi:hypothetical protein
MLDSLLKDSALSSTGEKPMHPSAWKVLSANFAFTEF